jgi:hypothetical protein
MKNETGPPKVFISSRESVCDECGEELGHHAWIVLAGERGALCLACAELDHLAFLAAGDAAVTRRAKKHSCSSGAAPGTATRPTPKWPTMSAGFEPNGGRNESQRFNRGAFYVA